ncbi:nucleolar protein dao-5-like isoform X2 [Haliotis asinina]|uniref:nucleolar protein dao-5-like isoform X2 n=1 Tax=Haliotis asinina TaxID=109174 RepID=UPI003531C3A6
MDQEESFKSHHSKQKPLQGGNRSISEDSVFNPGDRGEPSITALKTVAVSEENLNKNAFQNELFSKLKKRHSQYSDDDDGLPQSPVPPMTTADILGGPLKPVPGKSSSRESEKSLISVDSSDNEGDDPFLTKWNSPLKPRRSSDQSPPPAKTTSMDLEAVKRTPMLSNEAAKFKRSVKPRKQNRQSRKKKDAVSALGLPSLNEESPTKLQAEENAFATPGVDIPTDTTVLEVSSGPSEKPTVSLKPTELPPKPVATKPVDVSAKPVVTKPSVDASAKPVATKPPVDVSAKPVATKPSVDLSAKPVATKPSLDASAKPVATKVGDASAKTVSVTSPVNDAAAKHSLPGTVRVEVRKEPTSATRPSDQDMSRGRSTSLNIKEKVEPSAEKTSELSDAFNKLKRKSVKSESDELPKSGDKPDAVKSGPEVISFSVKKEEKSSEIKTMTATGRNRSASESASSVQKQEYSSQSKVEELKPVAKRHEDPSPASKPVEEVRAVQKAVNADKQPLKSAMTTGGEIKPTLTKQLSSDSNKEDDRKSDTSSVKSESFKKDVGFKVGSVTPSPKEDYKQKRQNRSKTLPEQPVLPDEFSSKVQRAKSQRADAAPVVPTATGIVSQRHGTPSSRKVEPKLHETKPSGQPEWMALVKNRKPAEDTETNDTEPKKEVLTIDTKDANKEKGSDKNGDKMSKSFTFSSASNSSTSPEDKKESFTISNSRSASVKIPSKVDSVPQSGPVRFGSVKTGSVTASHTTSVKSGSVTTTASSISKSGSMSQSSSSWTKTPSVTQTSVSRSATSTTPSSSSKPDSIKNLGSSVTEVSKDSKVSPTEGVKKDFGRVQSVKTPPSTSDTTPAWKSSSVKTANKTPVQSAPSSSDKKESAPAWRSGINKPPSKVTIEIIENEPKQEVVLRKKSPPAASTPEADSCRDSSSNRSSKVLDMVKSFQKLQVN